MNETEQLLENALSTLLQQQEIVISNLSQRVGELETQNSQLAMQYREISQQLVTLTGLLNRYQNG
jgi:RecA/RadA recombinase